VKGNESTGNGSNGQSAGSALQAVRTGQHRQSTYQKVRDERKRPIRGLWLRNGRYYAQITLEEPKTGVKQVRRVPLENAGTPAQAKAALEELLVRRRRGQTIVQRRAPKFAEFAEEYLEHHRQAKDIKRASTMATEGHAINRLKCKRRLKSAAGSCV
jgi:hypothetical protein